MQLIHPTCFCHECVVILQVKDDDYALALVVKRGQIEFNNVSFHYRPEWVRQWIVKKIKI